MNYEVHKYIQEYVAKMQAKGITPTIEQINKHLAECMQDVNNRPKEDFEGYSPKEMSKILYNTFDKDSPIQICPLPVEEYNQIPLFRQVKHLLQMLVENDIKLTTAGYLPPSIVKELYPLGIGDSLIDTGISKLSKEIDSISVMIARKICEAAGFAKTRKGILAATTNGIKITNDNTKLFKQLFETFCQKINWAYFDGYKQQRFGQFGFGFSLILLSKYANVNRDANFYAQKYFKAFPKLMDDIIPTYQPVENYCNDCYSLRTFERFMLHFSLVEISNGRKFEVPKNITKTALFDKLIKILPHHEF